MSSAHVTVPANTPAQLTAFPTKLRGAVVLNSGTVDIVIDNRDDVSLTPQSGCRLRPGDLMQFTAFVPYGVNGGGFTLWAAADGAPGEITAILLKLDD